MKITNKVRKITRLLPLIGKNTKIAIGITELNSHLDKLIELGFSSDLPEGESVLPSASYGTACSKNAEGWIEKHEDQPMEDYFTPVVWRWKQYKGRYDYEWHEEIRYRSGKRYPRTEHPPLGIELTIHRKTDQSKLAIMETLDVTEENYPLIVDIVNALIEIFGECELFKSDLESIIQCQVKRLNWRILPPGNRPWDSVRSDVKSIVSSQKGGTQKVIYKRLEYINAFKPDFIAVGQFGFAGYIVFGFTNKGIYLLESIYTGNATYAFSDDWKELSKLSKSEIIRGGLHTKRVVHLEPWHREISLLLK